MTKTSTVPLLFVLLFSCTSDVPVVESYPVEQAHRVTIDGVEVHYFDFHPDAPGTPLIYIHGYSGSAFEAFYFQDDLGPDYRIIAPDLPGAGLSEKPDIEYTVDYYVEFVRNFADALGIERYDLIGHSMGGQIATVLAARGEPALDRLILIAPYGLEGEASRVLEFLSNAGVVVDYGFVLHNETLVDIAIRLEVFHSPRKIPKDFVAYLALATFHTENAIPALASITRNIIGKEPTDALLPLITNETLIIWGADDRVLDFRYAADFNVGIENSRLVAIPDCGHLPQVEQQEITAKAIRRFLAGD